jgi:hypothetical protein
MELKRQAELKTRKLAANENKTTDVCDVSSLQSPLRGKATVLVTVDARYKCSVRCTSYEGNR